MACRRQSGTIAMVCLVISLSLVVRGALMVSTSDDEKDDRTSRGIGIGLLTAGLVLLMAGGVILIIVISKSNNKRGVTVATTATTAGAATATIANQPYQNQYAQQYSQPLRQPPANQNPPYPTPNQNSQYPPMQNTYPPPNQNPVFLNPAVAPPPYWATSHAPPSGAGNYGGNYGNAPPLPRYDIATSGEPFKQ